MKVKQFIGPFKSDLLDLTDLKNHRILQVGVEAPQSSLLFSKYDKETKKFLSASNNSSIILIISDISFSIGEADILEFENLYLNGSDIEIKIIDKTNSYLIVNIAYE